MRKKFILPAILLLLTYCFNSCSSSAQISSPAPGSLLEMLSAISAVADQQTSANRTIRLAIVPFTSSKQEITGNRFGDYLSERLVASLKQNARIRLFERGRLDAVIKENTLALSGLVNAEEARRLGELAPLDVLLTGTFTVLPQSIEINGRFIDVISGEIIQAFNYQTQLTADLLSFFTPPVAAPVIQNSAEANISPENGCKALEEEFKTLLSDLSEQNKIDKLAEKAIALPLNAPCSAVHVQILNSFKRYQLYPAKYRKFLLAALSAPDYQPDKQYILDILSYQAADSVVDNAEWQAGLEAVKKMSSYSLYNGLRYLFYYSALDKSRETQQKRVDEYFSLVVAGKIGRPVAVTTETAFWKLMEALNDYKLTYYTYQKYGKELPDKEKHRVFKYLFSHFRQEKDPVIAKQQFKDISALFNELPVEEKTAELILDEFLHNLDYRSTGQYTVTPAEQAMAADFIRIFVKESAPVISRNFATFSKKWNREEGAFFCLEHNIDCPQLVPSADSLAVQIVSEDFHQADQAAKYLLKYGSRAAKLEKQILRMMRYWEKNRQSGATNMLWAGIEILGNTRTQNPDAWETMYRIWRTPHHDSGSKVSQSFSAIGAPIHSWLQQKYQTESENYIRIYIIKILSTQQENRTKNLAFCRDALKKADNDYLKDALEIAIEKLTESR